MPIIRATAVLNMLSGVPEDAARNVWHFGALADDPAHLSIIGNGVANFYQTLGSLLSKTVSRVANAHVVELAEVVPGGGGPDDDTVTALLDTYEFGITTVNGTNAPLPPQVAIALSFRGDVAAVPEVQGLVRPRSRRRGRVFLGPFGINVIAERATTFYPNVTSAARELILDAYDSSHAIWDDAAVTVEHGIYSRADGQMYDTTQISVDESFDTIRRRKTDPTVKMVRSITPPAAQVARTGTDVVIPPR